MGNPSNTNTRGIFIRTERFADVICSGGSALYGLFSLARSRETRALAAHPPFAIHFRQFQKAWDSGFHNCRIKTGNDTSKIPEVLFLNQDGDTMTAETSPVIKSQVEMGPAAYRMDSGELFPDFLDMLSSFEAGPTPGANIKPLSIGSIGRALGEGLCVMYCDRRSSYPTLVVCEDCEQEVSAFAFIGNTYASEPRIKSVLHNTQKLMRDVISFLGAPVVTADQHASPKNKALGNKLALAAKMFNLSETECDLVYSLAAAGHMNYGTFLREPAGTFQFRLAIECAQDISLGANEIAVRGIEREIRAQYSDSVFTSAECLNRYRERLNAVRSVEAIDTRPTGAGSATGGFVPYLGYESDHRWPETDPNF